MRIRLRRLAPSLQILYFPDVILIFENSIILPVLRAHPMRATTLAVLCICLPLEFASAQQAVLTPVKDNTLYETVDGSTSNGIGDYFFVGRVSTSGGGKIRRGLIKFDIAASVPAGATINSVSLRLNMSKTTSGSQTVIVKRVTADWGEGTSNGNANEGSGDASAPGDATWIHRFKDTTNWTTPGGDFAAPVSASLAVNAIGAYTWASTTQLVADVQGWLNSPSTNFGWAVVGNEEATGTSKRFDSRENPLATDQPQLTVNYTAATSVVGGLDRPTGFALIGNYPNPFNPETQIEFRVAKTEFVKLSVYDLLGRERTVLVNGQRIPGTYKATWNAGGMPSGIYFAVLEAGGDRQMRRMILTK